MHAPALTFFTVVPFLQQERQAGELKKPWRGYNRSGTNFTNKVAQKYKVYCRKGTIMFIMH
jgi:hypothetical protein